MVGMGSWWVIGLAVIIGFAWWIARMDRGGGAAHPDEASPETILKQRYARGEIDREEYERRLADVRR